MLNYSQLLKKQNKYLRFGMERESLRISNKGKSVGTKHPFDNKFKNSHITVDFGEQQVELITGIHNTIESCIDELKLLTNIFYKHLPKDEIIWNYSMPLKDISKNIMATGPAKQVNYRTKLLAKSSVRQQLVSGIHFNWSLSEESTKKISKEDTNKIYYKVFKNYSHYHYLIKNMFGAAPTKDFKTFNKISYRQEGKDSYNQFNKKHIADNYKDYRKNINTLIKNKELIAWRNMFGQIRTKPHNAEFIEWIEIRNVDLEYLNEYGINKEALEFINYFILYLSDLNELKFDLKDTIDNSLKILKDVKKWLNSHKIETTFLNKYLKSFKNNEYPKRNKPNVKNIIDQQIKLKNKYFENSFALKEIEDMELSTQILIEKAYIDCFDVKIIDKKKNHVTIDGVLMRQATLNPFDSKKGLEIIDDKIKTNKFLKKKNYSATRQKVYKTISSAKKDFAKWKNKEIVIKPVSTNFSKGLTVLNFDFNKNNWDKGIEFAFSYDKQILVEMFEEGTEYRFMVINNKLVGVLKRIPANVEGDGKHNIKQLVEIKNKNPIRGQNYKKPLEKIKITNIENEFLEAQNLDVNYIPKKTEVVFLRQNSNVSTGGDTVDVTDLVHSKYKKIAIESTKKLDLLICGLDIIIPNISKFSKYTILEMNWNPAIHIHTYPAVGKNREPAKHILKLIKEENKV